MITPLSSKIIARGEAERIWLSKLYHEGSRCELFFPAKNLVATKMSSDWTHACDRHPPPPCRIYTYTKRAYIRAVSLAHEQLQVTRMNVKSKCTIPANHFEYFIMGAKYHYSPARAIQPLRTEPPHQLAPSLAR